MANPFWKYKQAQNQVFNPNTSNTQQQSSAAQRYKNKTTLQFIKSI